MGRHNSSVLHHVLFLSLTLHDNPPLYSARSISKNGLRIESWKGCPPRSDKEGTHLEEHLHHGHAHSHIPCHETPPKTQGNAPTLDWLGSDPTLTAAAKAEAAFLTSPHTRRGEHHT